MKRSIICVLVLALVSVGGFFGVRTLVEREEAQPKGFDPDTIPDVVQYTAGIPKDTVLATVNGQNVTAEDYLYWVGYVSEVVQYYQYGGGEMDWTAETEGVPLTDYVKDRALETATLYRVVTDKATELNCGFNAQNQTDYAAAYQTLVEQNGGEVGMRKALLNLCLTPDGFTRINQVQYLYDNLAADQTDSSPADKAELAAYVADNDLLRAKHILLMTVDPTTREPLSEEEQAAKLEQAEELLKQLRESDEPLTLFDTLMQEYSEDTGLAAYPDGYDFTAGDMVAPFEEGTRALEYGEISDIIESDYGYHIILRLDPADEELAAQLGEQQAAQAMDEMVNQWVTEAQVERTPAYDELDVAAFYANLTSLREEIAAADAAAQEPTPVLGAES